MGTSQLRASETGTAHWGMKRVIGLEALQMIRDAIAKRPGLIRGKLDGNNGAHCAVGCFWADHEDIALKTDLIDQIAKVNDSVKRDPKKRREKVLRWLDRKIKAASAPIKD